MIPYEVDPSLHPAEPAQDSLADGFSPRPDAQPAQAQDDAVDEAQDALGPQSPF